MEPIEQEYQEGWNKGREDAVIARSKGTSRKCPVSERDANEHPYAAGYQDGWKHGLAEILRKL